MSFTMPQFEVLEGDAVNPLAGLISKATSTYTNLNKAKYAPLTMGADAMSKIAYASLLGPQYVAKLLGNPDIVAQLKPDTQQNAVNYVTAAGLNGTSPSNSFVNPKLLASAFSKFRTGQPVQNQPMSQMISPNQNNVANAQSSQQYPMSASDQDQNQNVPVSDQSISQAMRNNQQLPVSNANTSNNPWAENAGRNKAIISQREQEGKDRANDIDRLGNQALDIDDQLKNLDIMKDVLTNPELQKIRKFPIGGHQELSYYAATGTPEQKNLIGVLNNTIKNAITYGSSKFKGDFREGEQSLLQAGLPNDKDTIDTMKGKYEAVRSLLEMVRSRDLMIADFEERTIPKTKAIQLADHYANGNKIRDKVHKLLYPNPGEADIQLMMNYYKTSREDIIKRLKKQGITVKE